MATRLDSGKCLRCGAVLIEIDPGFQLCRPCQKWATDITRALGAARKQMSPESVKNRRKLKVGALR